MAGHTHITGGALSITALLCASAAGCSAQAPTAPEHIGAAAITGPADMPASSPAGYERLRVGTRENPHVARL